jgi:hypothetical protein
MQANRKRRWPSERIPHQRAIMALTLAVYPHWGTIPELAREIGPSGALTRAALELIQIGLLESHGTAIRPTKPVAYLERLKLP